MTITGLPKGEVTEDVFRKIVSEVGSKTFREQYNRFEHPSDEYVEYYIHNGPINNTTTAQPQDAYLLVLGDVKTGLVNVNALFDNEMGEFILIGNVECDYFIHQHGKSAFIDGNLKVNKILNNAVDDSALIVTDEDNISEEAFIALIPKSCSLRYS